MDAPSHQRLYRVALETVRRNELCEFAQTQDDRRLTALQDARRQWQDALDSRNREIDAQKDAEHKFKSVQSTLWESEQAARSIEAMREEKRRNIEPFLPLPPLVARPPAGSPRTDVLGQELGAFLERLLPPSPPEGATRRYRDFKTMAARRLRLSICGICSDPATAARAATALRRLQTVVAASGRFRPQPEGNLALVRDALLWVGVPPDAVWDEAYKTVLLLLLGEQGTQPTDGDGGMATKENEGEADDGKATEKNEGEGDDGKATEKNEGEGDGSNYADALRLAVALGKAGAWVSEQISLRAFLLDVGAAGGRCVQVPLCHASQSYREGFLRIAEGVADVVDAAASERNLDSRTALRVVLQHVLPPDPFSFGLLPSLVLQSRPSQQLSEHDTSTLLDSLKRLEARVTAFAPAGWSATETGQNILTPADRLPSLGRRIDLTARLLQAAAAKNGLALDKTTGTDWAHNVPENERYNVASMVMRSRYGRFERTLALGVRPDYDHTTRRLLAVFRQCEASLTRADAQGLYHAIGAWKRATSNEQSNNLPILKSSFDAVIETYTATSRTSSDALTPLLRFGRLVTYLVERDEREPLENIDRERATFQALAIRAAATGSAASCVSDAVTDSADKYHQELRSDAEPPDDPQLTSWYTQMFNRMRYLADSFELEDKQRASAAHLAVHKALVARGHQHKVSLVRRAQAARLARQDDIPDDVPSVPAATSLQPAVGHN